MTIDLDALEKLADEATPGPWTVEPNEWDDGTNLPAQLKLRVNGSRWSKVANAVHVDDNDSAFIAAVNPATIKALIAELKEARVMAHTINRMLSPQADRTFDLLISQSQWAVDTCRAFLARNGEGE